MDAQRIERLARGLLAGDLSVDELVRELGGDPDLSADLSASGAGMIRLDEATLDIDRLRRCGFSEVVFGEGKPVATLEKIFRALLGDGTAVLATRITAEVAAALSEKFPTARYNEAGRTFRIAVEGKEPTRRGRVTIVTAGTSDLPVAEEARETLDWMGVDVTMIVDVGVAGPHRLPAHLDKLSGADAVVVVAGMEGALPSVVGGYVACPVIAVPTSVGYGASFGGVAALLAMLNSCAANVAVVNIDAGFKGAYIAGQIATRAMAAEDKSG